MAEGITTSAERGARCFALIPAAGSGTRTESATPKQYLPLADKPMIVHAIDAFAAVAAIERIVVIVARGDTRHRELSLADAVRARVEFLEAGGATRDASVANGLDGLAGRLRDDDWILVHDAARCGITAPMIEQLIDALHDDPVGGLMAVPVIDTIKRVANEPGVPLRRSVVETVDRAALWQAQTPQMFRYAMLRDALAAAHRAERVVTDESSAIEAAGHKPRLVPGAARNFKVTTADDLHLMDLLLRAEAPGA